MSSNMAKNISFLSVICLIFIFCSYTTFVDGAKILSIFPAVSKSHFKVGEALSVALAKAGHEVTLLNPYDYKSPHPNLEPVQLTGAIEIAEVGESLSLALARGGHEVTLVNPFDYKSPHKNLEPIQLTGAIEISEERTKTFNSVDQFNLPSSIIIPILFWSGHEFSSFTLFHEKVRKLMDTRHYDLIIVEIFCTEAMIGLGQHFNAPVIGVSTFGASKWTSDLVGTPSPLSYVPHSFSNLSDKMSFWDRAINTVITVNETVLYNILHYPMQKSVYNKAFPNAKLTFQQAVSNVSLVLLNTHNSITPPRPYVPNMIEVGGMHINREISELPKNIKDFLDSAKDGAIFFTLGSFMKSSYMSAEHKAVFINVFSKLKQKIIWKYEENNIKMPENVLISDWLPQNDILAHPNLKVFITHGGLLSTTESVYHGIPVLGMPFFGDQRRNVQGAVMSGWGLQLDYKNVTEESLTWALNEIITNSKYTTTVKEVSKRYRDQPLTPVETAVYWTEFVIRHKGAPHLQSGSMHLNFIEYHNVDVLLMLFIVSIIGSIITYKIIRLCCQKCCCSRKRAKNDVNKKFK